MKSLKVNMVTVGEHPSVCHQSTDATFKLHVQKSVSYFVQINLSLKRIKILFFITSSFCPTHSLRLHVKNPPKKTEHKLIM